MCRINFTLCTYIKVYAYKLNIEFLKPIRLEEKENVWKIFILKGDPNDVLILLQDMIHVVESKPAKRYGDFFLRQIVKVS